MDLGCLDMCCISVDNNKQSSENNNKKDGGGADQHDAVLASPSSSSSSSSSSNSSSKSAKNKSLRESLSKFSSQIKKPPHRKTSPINWFPRKKVDSFLKRKIKMLQEVAGMNLTLDETLDDTNPHYSRVLREKIAAREAAHKAMEARKAALVEASWCRILHAARIHSKEAEELLLEAEKNAAEAFEVATANGVIMYDLPNCPKKTCQIEASTVNGVGSTTHTITASFETAFEVDKEVAAAVKTAFVKLGNCPSFSKDEFKDLLRKISQNPDSVDNNQTLVGSSECELESASEFDTKSHSDDFNLEALPPRQRKLKRRQSLERLTMEKLVDMMVERLKCLHEDELSSLATIVATCGMNAALAQAENNKMHDPTSTADYCIATPRRISSFGSSIMRKPDLDRSSDIQIEKKHSGPQLPSLDKFLVKHMTKLEREVQEAKNLRKKESEHGTVNNADKTSDGKVNSETAVISSEALQDSGSTIVMHPSRFTLGHKSSVDNNMTSSEALPDLGSMLIKHTSKLEREIEEARRKHGKEYETNNKKMRRFTKEDVSDVPSLDKFLVKHISKLEKEVQEARNSRKTDLAEKHSVANSKKKFDSSNKGFYFDEGKENLEPPSAAVSTGGPEEGHDSLDKILVKPVHRLEREKLQALASGSDYAYHRPQKKPGDSNVGDCESLDKVLVKHVSRLEREKMMAVNRNEPVLKVKKSERSMNSDEGSLDQILVKPKSRLEREKMAFAAATHQSEDQTRRFVSRREAREREAQEAWGGLSLGNSIRPHVSKLAREKAAWIEAEEEQRRQATVKEI